MTTKNQKRRKAVLEAAARLKEELEHPDTKDILPEPVIEEAKYNVDVLTGWVDLKRYRT